MVDVDEESRISAKKDLLLRVAAADQCVMVIMQVLERAWPSPSARLKGMPDFDPAIIERERTDLLLLSLGVTQRLRRGGIFRTVSETSYPPARAHAAILCARALN